MEEKGGRGRGRKRSEGRERAASQRMESLPSKIEFASSHLPALLEYLVGRVSEQRACLRVEGLGGGFDRLVRFRGGRHFVRLPSQSSRGREKTMKFRKRNNETRALLFLSDSFFFNVLISLAREPKMCTETSPPHHSVITKGRERERKSLLSTTPVSPQCRLHLRRFLPRLPRSTAPCPSPPRPPSGTRRRLPGSRLRRHRQL